MPASLMLALVGGASAGLFGLLGGPLLAACAAFPAFGAALLVLARARVPLPPPDPLAEAALADCVLFRFDAAGEVADVSPSARTVLRLAPELLLAGGLFERLHVADRVNFLCLMGELRQGGCERGRVELRLRLPGTARDGFGAFALDLVRTPNAALPIAGLLRDDAALRQARAERDAALGEAARLGAERGRLLAALGHELRTPLNAVIGFSEMLGTPRFGGFTDPRQKEYADLIHASGEHLLRTADAILEAGTLGAGGRAVEPEAVSLRETAELCRAMLAGEAARRGVRLLASIGAGCETVRADPRILRQVLVNLLSNAVKFTPAGGEVIVEAERTSGGFELRVRDTGAGMAQGDLARAGTPFARFGAGAGALGEGTGLGLSLVRELVEMHGGALGVESGGAGEGTLVTASFPHGRDPAARLLQPLWTANGNGERNRDGATRKTA